MLKLTDRLEPMTIIISTGLISSCQQLLIGFKSSMRCTISSRADQVLANGHLLIQKDENGELRLSFRTDGGKLIQGGIIASDGDLTAASQELFRAFFTMWGMSDITLSAIAR